jgi:hypothetical protein
MHSACCHTSQYGHPAMAYYVPVCPWCGLPWHACSCWLHKSPARYQMQQEISADPAAPEKTVMIGGVSPVRARLEYMPVAGATSPSVDVVLTDPDGTATTINESSIPAGYHVKDDLMPLAPGTVMKLKVTECLARLRWLETFHY